MWFVDKPFETDFSKVTEVFIDATYNTSKTKNHLYAICAQELGYGVPLGYMLMEIHPKEDTKDNKNHDREALECNRDFYKAAKEMGVEPKFVHTDKDWCEISAAQVIIPLPTSYIYEHFENDVLGSCGRCTAFRNARVVGM
jgi:hypothetical protein